jgi:hypothetical protein
MDSDLTLYGIYDDIAWEDWLNNKRLIDIAQQRHDEISGWKFGSPFAHVPTIALDYLMEATLTYSFGFFRSSIFCCTAVLDMELKRCLMKILPNDKRTIEKQTFGQSIRFAIDQNPTKSTVKRLNNLFEINNIRNRVAVHPCKALKMLSCEEDETPFALPPEGLETFFSPKEIKAIDEESKKNGLPVDLLEKLSFKIIWNTKEFIAEGPIVFV